MVVFLDTETTGLSPAMGHSIIEVAIVDEAGRVLLNTLVNPERRIPYDATAIHGITDAMVCGQPTLTKVLPQVREVIRQNDVVIYNANFDAPFFPGNLREARQVRCAMRRFADELGLGWKKLDYAARHVGHKWQGQAHRALADAMACRSVWLWLEK